MKQSLTQSLTRWFLIFTFIPAILFSYASCKYMVVAAEHSTYQILNSICQKGAESIAFWFQERLDDLKKAVPTDLVKPWPLPDAVLNKAKNEIHGCLRIALVDAKGVILADTAGMAGNNISDSNWSDMVGRGQVYETSFWTNPSGSNFVIVTPVHSGGGNAGAIWAEFDVKAINSILQQDHLTQTKSIDSYGQKKWFYGFGFHPKKPEWSEIRTYLIGPDDLVVAEFGNQPSTQVYGSKSLPDTTTNADPEVVRWVQNKLSGVGTYINRNGEKIFSACQWIPYVRKLLVVEKKRNDVLHGIYSQCLTMILLTLLLTVLFTVPLNAVATRKLTEPLRKLVGEVNKVAAGNFGHQIVINAEGEVKMLTRAFNDMSIRLQEVYARMAQQIELLAQQKEEIENRNHELEMLQEQLKEKQAELEEKNSRLQEMADVDELTRVLNRRSFLERAMNELARARRYAQPVAAVMIDVDRFKMINDTYGHACGDLMLRELAGLIKNIARQTDLVGRYGGDEFAVILPATDLEGALCFTVRVLESAKNRAFITPFRGVEIGVSLGVSVWLADNNTADLEQQLRTLLHQADMALLEAKREGRNRAAVYGKQAS